VVRQGKAWLDKERQARLGRQGKATHGMTGQVKARQGRAVEGRAVQGNERRGWAKQAMAR
jgi:hypothetical protein